MSATVAFETPDAPGVPDLIAALDTYQSKLYPPECCYLLDLGAVAPETLRLAVARDAQGQALGCGALVLGDGQGEIKRMWVQPAARGQGLAQRLLARLETEARAAGCPWLVLETGPKQPAAIALYRCHGFETCGPFGDYRDDPMSVFMRKSLHGPVTC